MLHSPPEERQIGIDSNGSAALTFPISDYTTRQFLNMKYADTIIVDPHKTGYCPYPAGAVCYRNGAMRNFVKNSAEYILAKGIENAGHWGVDGSKPGASAAAVLLSHRVSIHVFQFCLMLNIH